MQISIDSDPASGKPNDHPNHPHPSTGPALATLSLTMLLASLGTSITNVALPALALAFDASFQAVQWVVIAYLLAVTSLVVSAGRLGDVIGRRKLMLGGLFLFVAASVLCGVAPWLWLLIAARAVQGLGSAIMMTMSMAFVGEMMPKEKTGSAMGLLGTISAVGTALGPALGGALIASTGWQAIFFINLPLGLLAFALAWRWLPSDRQASKKNGTRFDHPGTLLLAITLVTYALAATLGRGQFGLLNVGLLLAAATGFGLFLVSQMKTSAPLIELSMFRNPVLSAGFFMSMLVTTVVMATLVVGPFYLSGALALDAGDVGLVMSAGPFVAAIVGVPGGRMVDRLGAQLITLIGLGSMMVGSVSLSVMPLGFGVPGYILPLIAITAGYALFQAANNTAVLAHARLDQRGVMSGLLNMSRNVGLITGASVMGAVFAHGSATVNVSTSGADNIATGMHVTFAVTAVLIVVAIITASAGYIRSRQLAL